MTGAHQGNWEAWSAARRAELMALPQADLLLAVQTGALDHLTETDAKAVLSALGGVRGGLPAVRPGGSELRTIRSGGRQPKPLTSKGLPIGPKITLPMRLKRRAAIVSVGVAATLWALVFILGNHWLALNSTIG